MLMKLGLHGFTAVELGCLRISISFLVSLPLAIKGFMAIPRSKYKVIAAIGVFGSGIPAFLFPLSMEHSHNGSAINGVLNSLSPLWTLLIGYFLFQVVMPRDKVIGVVIGFLGALVLVLGKRDAGFKVDLFYSALPVIATMCYGMSTNITKQKMQTMNPLLTTSMAMSMIGVPAFAGLLTTGAPAKILSGSVIAPFLAIVVLAVVGTLVAWILFYRLVQRTDALFGASVTYLVPIVAVSLGLFDGEILTLMQMGGMLLILLGVYFTTRVKKV